MAEERDLRVKCCPFCQEDEHVDFIGLLDGRGVDVYYCNNCEVYFAVEEIKPPFKVSIAE